MNIFCESEARSFRFYLKYIEAEWKLLTKLFVSVESDSKPVESHYLLDKEDGVC